MSIFHSANKVIHPKVNFYDSSINGFISFHSAMPPTCSVSTQFITLLPPSRKA
eukprot:m.5210 g.5210  ORF g.5210 m.5210 type:complete len:53 (+) comp2356_c0_seq1:258-416(+)